MSDGKRRVDALPPLEFDQSDMCETVLWHLAHVGDGDQSAEEFVDELLTYLDTECGLIEWTDPDKGPGDWTWKERTGDD